MSVFMDDIATAAKTEHIRKGIQLHKDGSHGLNKTKYMIVKTGRQEEINETVKTERIQRKDKYKYLGLTISTVGH